MLGNGIGLSTFGVILRLSGTTNKFYINILRPIFMISPTFALGDGLSNLALLSTYSSLELPTGVIYKTNDLKITSLNLIYLGWTSIIYLLLTIIIEYYLTSTSIDELTARLLSRCIGSSKNILHNTSSNDNSSNNKSNTTNNIIHNNNKNTLAHANNTHTHIDNTHTHNDNTHIYDKLKDIDVLAEETRVLQGEANDDVIILKDLKKKYNSILGKGTYAVKGVSLGVKNGEVFGLLGGKRTVCMMYVYVVYVYAYRHAYMCVNVVLILCSLYICIIH